MNKKLSKKKRLAKHFSLLKLLSTVESDEARTDLMAALNPDCCDSIYDCLRQGLKNDSMPIAWRKELRDRLNGKEDLFRSLIGPKVSKDKRRKSLVQVGGDVSYILQGVLPLLDEYLNSNRK
jgi:hypothetical protein